nr:immunoglobulin light chain junction region [Macaca mulatta]
DYYCYSGDASSWVF